MAISNAIVGVLALGVLAYLIYWTSSLIINLLDEFDDIDDDNFDNWDY